MVRMLSLVAAVVLTAGSFISAAEVEIGSKAPTFSGIPGADGKEYGIDSFKEAKVLVVVFTCNSCPVAVDYEDRIIEFAKKYKDKGVSIIAVNQKSSEDIEAVKKRAEEKGFNFPYCYDKSQDAARAFGARVTPHFFVLDKDRTIQYMGAFDDSAKEPKTGYVADAVDALLAGKKVEKTETDAIGCGIGIKKVAKK
jgi:peroxiredoxin